MGKEAVEDAVQRMMNLCDTDGNGYVDYTEFISASMNKQTMLSKELLQQAFEAFDADCNGFISVDEIMGIMGDQSDVNSAWEEMIQAADTNGDGMLDIGEFIELMLEHFK